MNCDRTLKILDVLVFTVRSSVQSECNFVSLNWSGLKPYLKQVRYFLFKTCPKNKQLFYKMCGISPLKKCLNAAAALFMVNNADAFGPTDLRCCCGSLPELESVAIWIHFAKNAANRKHIS